MTEPNEPMVPKRQLDTVYQTALRNAMEVESMRQQLDAEKRNRPWMCATFFLIGFVVALVGVLVVAGARGA